MNDRNRRDPGQVDPGPESRRVLWITENHPPSRGGMAQSSDRIVRGLRRAGVSVDVAHLTRGPQPWGTEHGEGGRLLTCPLEDDPEHALRRLWTELEADLPSHLAPPAPERSPPDPGSPRPRPYSHVVAFGGTLPLLAAPVYAAWMNAPLVTLLRGNDFDTGVFSVRRRPVVIDALAASAQVCVVASGNVRLVQALVPNAPVSFVANGVDVGDWSVLPSERDRAQVWRAEHVAPDRRTIGLVGQLKRKKGVLFLLEALAGTPTADRVHLILCGDIEPSVLEWLARHDEIHHTLVPFLDRFELLGLFPACDVVALPSFYDGLPNVALEAAALGIPLLVSDAGGLADLVTAGENGFRFRAGDLPACRRALHELWQTDDADLRAMGRRGQDLVRSTFTAERETAHYLRVLTETDRDRPPA